MMLTGLFEWLIPAAQAHEKWFVEVSVKVPPLPAEFLPGSGPFTAAILTIVVLVVVGLLLDRRFERSALYAWLEARLRPLRDLAPGVLAISTSILLFWSAWQGTVLADEYAVPDGALGVMLRLLQVAIGVMFLIGYDVAAAALGLGILYLSLFVLERSLAPLDYMYFAGIAVFLRSFARGRYSLDWFYGKPVLSSPDGRKRAYLVMRVLTGLGLLSLASIKWLRPDLHFALMDAYPDWNPYVILGMIGLQPSREVYVLTLALIETTVGFYVLGGLFTRALAVMLVPVFMGSMLFLGPLEIIGHLPILGILFVMFVYGDTYHKAVAPARTP